MSDVRTIFKNMSWLAISQVITSVLAFIWTILIARYLGVSDYGIFGFAVSLTSMLAVCGDLGISTHIIRSIATDYNISDKYLGNAIPLKVFLYIIYAIIVYGILLAFGSSKLTIYVSMLLVIETAIKGFCSLFYGVFQAHEKGKYQGVANTILAIATFAFISGACYFDLGLSGITWAYVLANVLTIAYTIYGLLKYFIVPKFKFDFSFWKQLILWGIPFALSGIFYTIYYSIDIVMLTKLIGDYATGIYNATYKLINVLTLFYSIYTAVIFPVMSKQYKNQESSLILVSFEKSTKYLSLVTIPISVAVLIYAPDIIHFIYGNQYEHAAEVLQILIWTVCFLFINGAASNLLNACHKEVSVTKIYCIAAIVNIILNIFMIPAYSYIGASVSTVLSEIVILFLEIYALKKINTLPKISFLKDIFKIIISSFILGGILYVLKLNMWIAIPISIVIYLGLLIIFRNFDDIDKSIFKQIIGKN